LNTKLFPPHTRSPSLLLHRIFAVSLPSSLHEPLDLPPRSLSYSHQFSLVLRSQINPFYMQHLTCGTVFLLCVFLVSQLRHTALHRHPLIQKWSFTCLMESFILVSKLAFSPSLFRQSPVSSAD